MAAKPIEMSKLRKVLSLHTQGKSKRLISEYLRLSRNTVKKHLKQFHELKLTYEALSLFDDAKLEELFIKTELQELPPTLKTL